MYRDDTLVERIGVFVSEPEAMCRLAPCEAVESKDLEEKSKAPSRPMPVTSMAMCMAMTRERAGRRPDWR